MKLIRKTGLNKAVMSAATCLTLIAALLVPVVLPLPQAAISAHAAQNDEMPDLDRTGSISITFQFFDESSGKKLPVSGGNSVGLYKVADAVVDNGYKFVVDERFAAAGEIPATDEELDSANLELAEKMAEIASSGAIDFDAAAQEMDAEGKVSFEGLSVGLYLVMQDAQGSGDNKYVISPFLISIPYRNPDGTLTYDVTAESKPIGIGKIEPPPKPDKPDKPSRIPQTGQLWWPVMALGIAGALFVLAGVAVKVRK